MADITIFRGGTPDFKPMFCAGEYAQFTPPFSSPHFKDTPPYNSHADAAHGQGYLNLHFPLNPNLQGNYAHRWQQLALKGLKDVGDNIWIAWVPLRSFVVMQHIECVRGDEMLDGVYIKPVAKRVFWDFASEQWVEKENTEYAAAVGEAGVTQFPLGKFKDTDKLYGLINLTPKPGEMACTFGHNIPKFNDKNEPVEGLDEYYGGVVLGYQIIEGAASKIAELWRGNYAVYMSAKLLAFEGSTQVG